MSFAEIQIAASGLPENQRGSLAAWLLESLPPHSGKDASAEAIEGAARRREDLNSVRMPATRILAAPEMIGPLPVHDADFISLCARPLSSGGFALSATISIHEDESLEPLSDLGLKTRSVSLIFEHCWQVVTNFLGYNDPQELLSSWDVLEKSELLNKFKEWGFAKNIKLYHHRFEFSGGSTLDVLCERTFIEENSVSTKTAFPAQA